MRKNIIFLKTCIGTALFFLPISLPGEIWAGSATTASVAIDPEKVQKAKEFLEKGNQFEERGLTDKAHEYWEIAVELDPQLSEAKEKLDPVLASKEKKSSQPPVEELQGISGAKKQRVADLLSRARTAYDQNNYSEAMKYLEAAEALAPHQPQVEALKEKISVEDFKSDPDRPYNHLVKNSFQEAVEHYRLKHYEQALQSLDEAANMDPDNSQIQELRQRIQADYSDVLATKEVQRAKNQWLDENDEIAMEILDKLLLKKPTFQPALDLKKQIESKALAENSGKLQKAIQQGKKAENNNRFLEAKKYYEEAIKIDPENKDAQTGLESISKLVDPLESKVKGLERDIKAGQKDLAEADLREIEELKPDHPQLARWKKKVSQLADNGTSDDSQAKADEAYNLGLESYRKGDLTEAKKFWSEALDLNPQYSQARRNLDRLLDEHPELK